MVPSRTGQIAHEVHGSSSSATDHRISFTNWQKGNCLGSGSYCTVHVGFTEDGFVFAVKDMRMPKSL
nr:mitogen-activated protein kinase kinase kinase 1-like [Tanacetum cinerariifolium]